MSLNRETRRISFGGTGEDFAGDVVGDAFSQSVAMVTPGEQMRQLVNMRGILPAQCPAIDSRVHEDDAPRIARVLIASPYMGDSHPIRDIDADLGPKRRGVELKTRDVSILA